jgi:hypothetical protein
MISGNERSKPNAANVQKLSHYVNNSVLSGFSIINRLMIVADLRGIEASLSQSYNCGVS